MKCHIKSKLFGNILSDGSVRISQVFGYNSYESLNVKNIDIINHAVWTGRRPNEQTEISRFIGRFKIKK